jgi:hypothetical protein
MLFLGGHAASICDNTSEACATNSLPYPQLTVNQWIITISLEMPVPSQGHYVFTFFRLLTDFVCLYNYEF